MGHRPSDLDRVDHEATFRTILGGSTDLLASEARWKMVIWKTKNAVGFNINMGHSWFYKT